MLKRALFALCFTLIIGFTAVYLGLTLYIHNQDRKNQEAAKAVRPDIRLTFIEGQRREEMAAQLEAAGICSAQAFLEASAGQEGYLFPDTYRFYTNTPAIDVYTIIRQNFEKKIEQPLHPNQEQLTLASIIEREAQQDSERPLIAGVYTNRLRQGMKLDADPTVQYAKDNQNLQSTSLSSYRFWQPITQADYQAVQSPFNTYIHTGLPPAPIANPGRASILAAQNPAQHSYYYFLYKEKRLLLSTTLEEHESKQ